MTFLSLVCLALGPCDDDSTDTGDEPVPACKPGDAGYPNCPVKPPAPEVPKVEAPAAPDPAPTSEPAPPPAPPETAKAEPKVFPATVRAE